MPATQDRRFKTAMYVLSELLLEENNFNKYMTILAFLKEHPSINLILLQFAAVGTDMKGNLTSRILASSMEVKGWQDITYIVDVDVISNYWPQKGTSEVFVQINLS